MRSIQSELVDVARAERRANISQRPMVLGRHGQFAGTARARPQFTKSVDIPSANRRRYSFGEGLQ